MIPSVTADKIIHSITTTGKREKNNIVIVVIYISKMSNMAARTEYYPEVILNWSSIFWPAVYPRIGKLSGGRADR